MEGLLAVTIPVGLCLLVLNLHNVNGERSTVTAANRPNDFSLRCTASELQVIQRRWKYLMDETQTAQKVQLYRAVREYVNKRLPKLTMYAEATDSAKVPVELTAYRMFSSINTIIDALRTKDKLKSRLQHMALTEYEKIKSIINGYPVIVEAYIAIFGNAIIPPDEFASWELCLSDIIPSVLIVLENFRFQASCDVKVTSGDPDYPIHGRINFTQQASGGPTTINTELAGFQPGNGTRKLGMHIHEGGTIEDRCMKAGAYFNPLGKEHGAPRDENRHLGDLGNIEVHRDGRVIHTKIDDGISLLGPNGIIGKTVVIHEMEDDLGRGGYDDSKTTGHAGGRIACCVIYQTYE